MRTQRRRKPGEDPVLPTAETWAFHVAGCEIPAGGEYRDATARVHKGEIADGYEPDVDGFDSLTITVAKHGYALKGKEHENQIKAHMWSEIVVFSADSDKLEQAEQWMKKMDARKGFQPEVRAVNALIRAYIRAGNFLKAEEWFLQLLNPHLSPELGNIAPDSSTFNYMIRLCAQAGELVFAEAHIEDMKRFGLKPTLLTYSALVRGCIKVGEARRGHRWFECLLASGCAEHLAAFDAVSIASERARAKCGLKVLWDMKLLDDIVLELAYTLADSGNTESANRWLGFAVESGRSPEDAPETWEHVRAAHPVHIIPTLLSGESEAALGADSPRRGAPSVIMRATLHGDSKVRSSSPSSQVQMRRVMKQKTSAEPTPRRAQVVAARSQPTSQLMAAIAAGEDAGLTQEELQGPRLALALEERRDAARVKLSTALQQRELVALHEALSLAKEAGLDESDESCGPSLREVLVALEQEEKKRDARAKLDEAMRLRSITTESFSSRALPKALRVARTAV
mmetsp:Transcript_71614/g.142111  ORF Transcript_71614/g.142111 Transcript_71614/m.142111 type:complete len:513 (+) Transcript_71614:87-1625(+)|eukprot:CAMPEP_0172694544 /NCGR_PEP_ID=MMETSP1074-20121228/26739_1 /TAXON_ID=2916 /ORGANISM="Ceratium fusus, Strain PA161109" /LENGTH=512 /DNA_ID=CAMNT_0013515053 /DNA_START=86 /DNA_END=1624 /DNA_ORIENTATION=-